MTSREAVLEDAKGALAVAQEGVQAGDPVGRLVSAVGEFDGRFLRNPQGGLIVRLPMRSDDLASGFAEGALTHPGSV